MTTAIVSVSLHYCCMLLRLVEYVTMYRLRVPSPATNGCEDARKYLIIHVHHDNWCLLPCTIIMLLEEWIM